MRREGTHDENVLAGGGNLQFTRSSANPRVLDASIAVVLVGMVVEVS